MATGTGALNQGANAAAGYLGVNNGSNALSQLGFGYDRGRGAIAEQYGAAQGTLGQIGGLYDPLVQSGGQALSARDDALGLNGQEGYGRAREAFTSSLGYNAGLDGGLDAVQRSAAARGMLAGGNTSRDLFNYGADYQNRQAGSYLDRLTGASQNLNQGIAGRAAGLGALAGTYTGLGDRLATMDQGYGQNMATLYGQGAAAQLGLGQGIAGLNAQATGALVQNNNQRAQAEAQASGNLLGLATNLFSGGNLSSLAGLFR